MKKLFIYALLLVTGFAFYSCDDRFDNPVTQQQDPSNPNATWTYEVGIKFQKIDWTYWDEEAEEYKGYEAPTTVFVYNKAFEKLGELTAVDEIEEGTFNKFAGILTGAVGEELIISSLDNFDFYSKQDGTMKSIIDNGILQIAEVPIIITNATTGKIGTQNVALENQTSILRSYLQNWADSLDKEITITADSMLIPSQKEAQEKSVTIKLSEEAKPNWNRQYFGIVSEANEEGKGINYTFELNSPHGYKSIGTIENVVAKKNNYARKMYDETSWTTWPNAEMYVKELDLTKYAEWEEELYPDHETYYAGIDVPEDAEYEPLITQSGSDKVCIELVIRSKATIKDINIGKKGCLRLEGHIYYDWEGKENITMPTLTVKGTNTIYNKEAAGIQINALATIVGDGTITSTGNDHGLVVNSTWEKYGYDENHTWFNKYEPSQLTIGGDVKIIAKGNENAAVYVGEGWNYDETQGTWVSRPCSLDLMGGTLEAIGKDDLPAIAFRGHIHIGKDATMLKGTVEEDADFVILNNETGEEAKIEDLVEKKDDFNDSGAKDGVRTITPKK